MEYSSNDVKQLFRSVYTLVKGQDELKAGLTANETLAPKFLLSHRLLVSQCIQLMFEDFESVGRKSREILWRKGYYDVISALKRQKGRTDGQVLLEAADQLIREGINYFKAVVLRFGEIFHLDTLKHLVDYGLLEDYDDEALRQESTCYSLLQMRPASHGPNPKELYTKQEVSYALETIHTLLIALGDLHRYRMEFGIGNRIEIRDRTRSYYMEAFKLNPKIGMAQNQLGMLVAGQNNNLDAVYHYLYSLCCANPFECSETNVNNIFQKNILLLENGGLESSDFADEDDHAVKQFISAFLLVVDVFFYNKDVTDFMSLCHSVLIDFKKVLGIRQLLEEYVMTEDMIFKVVSILFFCMYRIKLTNSDKIHSLNAFLVALCSELLEYCTMGVEKCIVENVRDDNRFREMYLERYRLYDEQVHRARTMAKHGVYSKDQKSSSGVEEGTGSQDSRGTSNPECDNNCKDKPKDKNAKKTGGGQRKQSRRRRRAYSNGSDSDGNDHGDVEEDEYSDGNYDSDNDFSESDSSVEDGEQEEEEEDDMISLSSFGSYDDYTGGEEDEREDVTGRGAKKKHSNLPREVAQQPRGPTADEEFKYKKRYNKTNPNIVLEFAHSDRTIRSLKMLFDWLLCNMDVLHNCYQSNPEFVHNIMKLLNHFNIDIFTNRFFFCREFITMDGLREDLSSIFLARRTIPLREDVAMKRFPLFEPTQDGLQWEQPYKLGISAEDECLLRMMKLVDFGFTLCKSKKFDYCFVPKTREFSLRAFRSQSVGAISKSQQRRRKKKLLAVGYKSEWNGGGKQQQQQQGGKQRAQHQRQMGEKRRDRDGNDRQPRHVNDDDDPGDIFHFPQEYKRNRNRKQEQHDDPSSLPENNGEQLSLFTKKGYLRNRENGILRRGAAGGRAGELSGTECAPIGKEKRPTPVLQPKPAEKKKDLRYKMGRLYLRHCVGTRESELQVNKRTVRFSPYLVLDAKCLSEYTSIVKNLVKTGTFIVLIPSIVLSELDETKKDNDGARNAIKWLETEFGAGNRFLRTQTANESQPMPLVKIPKKLDREGVIFQHIVQFCNHFVSNHPDKDKNGSIVTYLSGDNLSDKKFGNGSSYVGILEAIPVKFEQIVTFYSSYKRK
ncbi:nonsense-mediated mRNA decay factor SMG5 [Anopheles bellator]|uniref:nonsense-mediated mRNA decay factor SMG5 n=1 Tax=Anopheles bellator TaxID=139047 RepID=UPI00264875A0|nr:nonsense-mediated mRNA decay factor SMG5 [Anopheles bellator]